MTAPEPPNIFLGSRCNQDCLFCSGALVDKTQSPRAISAVIAATSDTLSIEGGEPTLCKDLEGWARAARHRGIRDVILCTNGARLTDAAYVRRLCAAGITLFNVNFPAHDEKLFDVMTRTSGQFPKRLAALRELIAAAGGRRVRLNMVVTCLNALVLPQYVRFVRARFPEIFYIEFNLVKVLGYVERRAYLVPRLADAAPRLRQALGLMARSKMKAITDGFPLCHLDGCEESAIDAYKLLFGDRLYMEEKSKSERCAGCSLGALCAGPRKDYLALYGDGELRASRKDPGPIAAKVLAMGARR